MQLYSLLTSSGLWFFKPLERQGGHNPFFGRIAHVFLVGLGIPLGTLPPDAPLTRGSYSHSDFPA